MGIRIEPATATAVQLVSTGHRGKGQNQRRNGTTSNKPISTRQRVTPINNRTANGNAGAALQAALSTKQYN